MSLSEKVRHAVRRIPKGKVATYADIAQAIGRPRAWRAVGNILHKNRDSVTPCHRVVRSDGHVGGFGYPGGAKEKIRRLKSEGVPAPTGVVRLLRFRIHTFRQKPPQES